MTTLPTGYEADGAELDALVDQVLGTRPRPIDWSRLEEPELSEQWVALDVWVRWLVTRYCLDHREIHPAGPSTATSSKNSLPSTPPTKPPTTHPAPLRDRQSGTKSSPTPAPASNSGSPAPAAASPNTAPPSRPSGRPRKRTDARRRDAIAGARGAHPWPSPRQHNNAPLGRNS